MKKRAFALLLVVVLLLSAMPFAFAEDECCDEHAVIARGPAYCPVCALTLSYRTYNVRRSGTGDICYQIVTFGQASCPQHGDVYGAEELSSRDYDHNWVSDYLYGGVICRECGKRGTVIVNNVECPGESVFHKWTTVHLSGGAKCIRCNLYWNKPLTEAMKQEDMICPNHRTFHKWAVDSETGNMICESCGEVGLEIVVE